MCFREVKKWAEFGPPVTFRPCLSFEGVPDFNWSPCHVLFLTPTQQRVLTTSAFCLFGLQQGGVTVLGCDARHVRSCRIKGFGVFG